MKVSRKFLLDRCERRDRNCNTTGTTNAVEALSPTNSTDFSHVKRDRNSYTTDTTEFLSQQKLKKKSANVYLRQ